jgi:hypothetical protein
VLELTAGLDEANGRHVLDAIAHRFGWHERGTSHLVNGRQVDEPPRRATTVKEPLPSFEDIRGHAYRALGDAADWLRSDYRPGTGPCSAAADAVRRAFLAIGAAKEALNDAANAQTRAGSRHRAEAQPAQYPEARHG